MCETVIKTAAGKSKEMGHQHEVGCEACQVQGRCMGEVWECADGLVGDESVNRTEDMGDEILNRIEF